MRAAIYARVSTGKQATSDLSIPDQIAQCERFCEGRGWEVVKPFIDAGVSATSDNRPEFQAMIAETCSREKPFDVILVHSQSRFARSVFDLLNYKRKLEKNGVELISITQDMGNSDQSDFMYTMMGAMDEHHSKETSKHVKRSMIENAKQGFWNGSRPPFGYQTYIAETRGQKAKKKLEIATSEAEIVRLIFKLYTQGDGQSGPLGLRRIADYLNKRGISNRDAKPFRIQFLQTILRNTAYITKHFFNKNNSKTKQHRPCEEWVAFETPRIVDDYVFQLAQDKLDKQNPLKTPPRLTSSNVLLTGIAHCDDCGSPLRIYTGKGNRYRYYKCSRKGDHGASVCKGYSIADHKLDDLVIEAMLGRVITPERLEAILPQLVARAGKAHTNTLRRIKALTVEKRTVDKQLTNLYTLIATDTLERDSSLSTHIRELQQTRETITRQIIILESQTDDNLTKLSKHKIKKFAEAVHRRLRDPKDRGFAKAYLGALIERIDAGKQEIKIKGKNAVLASQAAAFDGSGGPVLSFDQQWCPHTDSNRGPTDYKSVALPAEL